jgi:hypothetical protein
LNKQAFSLHHGLAGERTDISQTKYGGAVRNNGN